MAANELPKKYSGFSSCLGRKQALMEGTHVVSLGYISLKRSVQFRVPVIREKPLKTG